MTCLNRIQVIRTTGCWHCHVCHSR
jgi:hypothetical protein